MSHPCRTRAGLLPGLVLALAGCLACTPTTSTECQANDQCTPEQECRNNRCETRSQLQDGGLVRLDGSVALADASQADAAMQQSSDAGMGGPCPHNDDGVLTAEELPLALNVEARFIGATSDGGILVDLTGASTDAGTLWDFSAAVPGDAPQQVAARPLTGKWFESHFPDGGYYIPLDQAGENLGIYQRTSDAVLLLGVASETANKTVLLQNPAVPILKFPLQVSTTPFTDVSTTTSGIFNYIPYPIIFSADTYKITADARGTVKTPAAQFPSLRVRVENSVLVLGVTQRWVRHSFISACYSQVASVASMEGETNPLFTHAAELRRMGLPQ